VRRTPTRGPGSATRPVLLTVSGVIPDDLAEQVDLGRRPRADYVLLSEAFDADLLDVSRARAATGAFGHLLERVGGAGLLLAWVCFRQRSGYEVIVTDGEQVGLPFAGLCRLLGRRRARHMMIVHVLTAPKKAWLVRALRLTPMVDRFVVYCSSQRDHLVERLGAAPEQVLLTPFMVDGDFFAPRAVDGTQEPRLLCSAGLERRDYPTLMRAVDGLDAKVVIAAASPWSTWTDSSAGIEAPANVEIRRLGFFDLRQLYADAEVVVMPLVDVDFQAGITTILEAMAMARPVVCTRTTGQSDTIVDGSTGVYVPSGDAAALREAILALLADRARARQLGERARRWVEEHATIERYAERLAIEVDALRAADGRQGVG
jgi:glycosyltransferase involved in cell wall biosynthesis